MSHYKKMGGGRRKRTKAKGQELPAGLESIRKDLEALPAWEQIDPELPETDPLKIRQRYFIECYMATLGDVEESARLSKITPRTFYRWMKDEGFVSAMNERSLEWELKLRAVANLKALTGDKILLMFLLKFHNPYYDDAFRAKMVAGTAQEDIFDRHPPPTATILSPEIPERFLDTPGPVDGRPDAGEEPAN